jgi:hypothetical protein
MKRFAAFAVVAQSSVLSQLLIAAGIAWLIGLIGPHDTAEVGVVVLAFGLLVAMLGVADRLVPDAGRGFTLTLKFAAVVLLVCFATLAGYSLLTAADSTLSCHLECPVDTPDGNPDIRYPRNPT